MLRNMRQFVLTMGVLCSLSVTLSADDKKPTDAPAPAAKSDAKPAATAPADLSGKWSGTWLSHSNDHDGPIEACFRKIDDNHYCVHFEGRFWELFPFDYDMVLTVVERKEDKVTMSGSKNLGFLFGTFSYTATVTDTDFIASYCSKHDHGVFCMTRQSRCCQ